MRGSAPLPLSAEPLATGISERPASRFEPVHNACGQGAGPEDLDIARLSCRSGGENHNAAGSGDDLSVELTFHTLDGFSDPDPDGLHSVSVFLGDATGPVADGERYELPLAEDELAGFTSGGSVPAVEGTGTWTSMRRLRRRLVHTRFRLPLLSGARAASVLPRC